MCIPIIFILFSTQQKWLDFVQCISSAKGYHSIFWWAGVEGFELSEINLLRSSSLTFWERWLSQNHRPFFTQHPVDRTSGRGSLPVQPITLTLTSSNHNQVGSFSIVKEIKHNFLVADLSSTLNNSASNKYLDQADCNTSTTKDFYANKRTFYF